MPSLRLAACALLCAPIVSHAQPAPDAPVPAAAAAAAPLDPFTSRGRVVMDAVLRGGPDALAAAKATIPAGTPVDYVPAPVRGFHRVRVATGESGYVPGAAITADETRRDPVFTPRAVPAPPAASALRPPPPAVPSRLGIFARGGFAIPMHGDLDGFDNGYALEVGGIGRLSEDVAIELCGGWSRVKDSIPYFIGELELALTSVPLLAGVRFGKHLPDGEVWAVVGGGMSFVSLDSADAAFTDSDRAPVFQLGAGAAFGSRSGARAELGLRFVKGSASGAELEGGFDTMTLSAGLSF